jgi:hypothetical protein
VAGFVRRQHGINAASIARLQNMLLSPSVQNMLLSSSVHQR